MKALRHTPVLCPLVFVAALSLLNSCHTPLHEERKKRRSSNAAAPSHASRATKPRRGAERASSSSSLPAQQPGSSQAPAAPTVGTSQADGKHSQAIQEALDKFAKVREQAPAQAFTLRFLIGAQASGQGKPIPFKPYSHLTIGYLGTIAQQRLEALLRRLEAEDLTELSQEQLTITALRRVGPQGNLYAFEVQPGAATRTLIGQLWTTYGVLEAWQLKKGERKGPLPSLLHITLGRVDQLAHKGFTKAALEAWIGTKLSLQAACIDVKPLGPHDPVYSKALLTSKQSAS